MGNDIRIVDPADVEPAEPAAGLLERTAFRIGDRRLALFGIDDGSSWHQRGGAVYGWVRAGRGRLVYDDRETDLERGDFLRVPANTVHRYAAGHDGLELLAVVDGDPALTEVDGPTPVDEADEPAVVGPDGLVPTVESPDLTRETPFPDSDVLMMRVRAAGGAAAGWHHHGENVYFGYAVDGPSETEYGPEGDEVARIGVGECFTVPPGLVHRDTNPPDEPHTGIIWLCGGEPWVVNVDGPE
jgi:mannose-6-phosphate isomerase-like protein (cupin superfamily)